MFTVITTVGTSLLRNRYPRPWSDYPSSNTLPRPEEVARWLSSADPTKASAEIHTWYRLGILEPDEGCAIVLICTNTNEGIYCAERLCDYARSLGIEAKVVPVSELKYSSPEAFNRGLNRLVRVIAENIRSARNQGSVAIAATGGYKAEIAVANLVGSLLNTPVYYIYDEFQQLVRIDPLPITLAPEWLRSGAGRCLLEKIGHKSCIYKEEIDSLLKQDPKLEILLEEADIDDREHVCANLLGELAAQLIMEPEANWPEPCDIEPQKKIMLQEGHTRPRGWEELVNRLARDRYIRSIRYDPQVSFRIGIREARDNETDIIIIYGSKDEKLPLRLATTAKNKQERQPVLDFLKRTLKF